MNHKALRTAVKKHLQLTKPRITLLASGESNTNYLVDEKYLLRVSAKQKHNLIKEFKILNYLKAYAVAPVPIIKDTSRTLLPKDFIIIEYIPGEDLSKNKLSKKLIEDLAHLTATLHSVPIKKNLPHSRRTYAEVKTNISTLIRQIQKYGGTTESNFLEHSHKKLQTKGPKNIVTIAHGDICEKNVICSNNIMKLIDFESCAISDPAYDIADIFTGFGKTFTKKHQDIFFQAYAKTRTDKSLRARVDIFIPLKAFETWCWSIMHVYEIKAGVLAKEVAQKKPLQDHIDLANSCQKQCKDLGLINEPFMWSE